MVFIAGHEMTWTDLRPNPNASNQAHPQPDYHMIRKIRLLHLDLEIVSTAAAACRLAFVQLLG